MVCFFRNLFVLSVMLLITAMASVSHAAPTEKEIREAMRKAAGFMVDTVSCNGGYLWNYAADLSDQWGEAPARPSQIWVQGATCEIGEMFLHAYKVSGDEYYLICAEKAANALIYGQHPLGGWNYFVEFDKTGLDEWYKDVFSQFKWGMEEYRHYYGNCTYDDNTTQGATRFLLRLYMNSLNPAYREPLLDSLNFLLISQYPNGAWPQRYPLRYEFVHDGLADYTSYYTMNDNSMRDIIDVLVEAYEKLGNEEYWKAAIRGMEFIIVSQMPEPQAGWAEQYDMNMQPAWARTHEPAGIMPRQSVQCIAQLEQFYYMTGDRRFLSPIPAALRWLENSAFEDMGNGHYKLARYYEVGTNKPIYQHKTDQVNEEGYGLYHYDSDPTGVTGGWVFTPVNIDALKRQYEKISALPPEEARAVYQKRKEEKHDSAYSNPEAVARLISSMDNRGAWIEDISVYDITQTMKTENPRKTIKGISIASFRRNMTVFIEHLASMQKER